MVKSVLIKRLEKYYPSLRKARIKFMVDSVFDEIIHALAQQRRVELRGFGTFSVRKRAAHQGRNPSTGDIVFVPAKSVPHFKASKKIKELINTPPSKSS